jgi:hypothetical protein
MLKHVISKSPQFVEQISQELVVSCECVSLRRYPLAGAARCRGARCRDASLEKLHGLCDLAGLDRVQGTGSILEKGARHSHSVGRTRPTMELPQQNLQAAVAGNRTMRAGKAA